MRYTYKMPACDTAAFQANFARELSKRIVPGWIREVNTVLQLIAMSALAWAIVGVWWKGIAVGFAIWYLLVVWQRLYARMFHWLMARRLRGAVEAETWICEIDGDRITHENRGMRTSFPLCALSDTWLEEDCLILDFGDLGRSRVVLAAIEDPEERARIVEEMRRRVKKAEPGATDNPGDAQ